MQIPRGVVGGEDAPDHLVGEKILVEVEVRAHRCSASRSYEADVRRKLLGGNGKRHLIDPLAMMSFRIVASDCRSACMPLRFV
jgi:hypothetical protein